MEKICLILNSNSPEIISSKCYKGNGNTNHLESICSSESECWRFVLISQLYDQSHLGFPYARQLQKQKRTGKEETTDQKKKKEKNQTIHNPRLINETLPPIVYLPKSVNFFLGA